LKVSRHILCLSCESRKPETFPKDWIPIFMGMTVKGKNGMTDKKNKGITALHSLLSA
jgi:hypothetical protein